jgi:hypothetical protein
MPSFAIALASALAVLPFVQAIQFNPVSNSATGSKVTVTWSSVDTDPAVFSLYLWNFAVFPPYYEPLAFGVNTTSGTASVRIPCSIPGASGAYQFSAINGTNVYVIYAQSADFSIDDVPCTDPTPTSSALTVTVTQTLSCGSNLTAATTSKTTAKTTTVSSHPTGSLNATVATVTPTTKPTTITVSSASMLGGGSWVPVIIGWLACAVAFYF